MAEEKLNHGIIMKALDYAYDKAINGIPGFDSAEEMARDYMNNGRDKERNCKALVNWQASKATTSGFITGLGGVFTMPVTIPANLASVMYVQVRMIAAIAFIGGYDLKDDRVKSLVYLCLAGNSAKDILKDIGIAVGQKITTKLIQQISGKTLQTINQKVGFRLLTKFGEKGIINLGKAIPIAGGLIGGMTDLLATKIIGKVAISTFINLQYNNSYEEEFNRSSDFTPNYKQRTNESESTNFVNKHSDEYDNFAE